MPYAFLPLLPFDEVLTAEIGELGVSDHEDKNDGSMPCGPKTSAFPFDASIGRCDDEPVPVGKPSPMNMTYA